MYDKLYAKKWIQNHESKKDIFREKYLNPYFSKKFSQLKNKTILDIGCGWGAALEYIPKENNYYGIDPTAEFLEYIKNKFQEKHPKVKIGHLPNSINIDKNNFDIIICSQVLHTIPNVKESIKTIFSKSKENKEVIIITFNEALLKKSK